MTNVQFNDMLIKKNLKRYLQGNRLEKGKILDELELNTGMHRKSLIRSLKNLQLNTPNQRGGSKPKYRKHEMLLLELAWEANDYICAERMWPLNNTVNYLRGKGYTENFTERTINRIANIPLGTLKQRLSMLPKARRKSTNSNSQGELKKIVPIRTNFNGIKKVGYFGVDFVDHTGGDPSGKYLRTFSTVEVVTQWITRGATRGRDRQAVESVAEKCLVRIPLHIYELHSDNESNLIHSLLKDFCRSKKILVTRTRSYQSKDNAHVEQKNGDKIRNLVGYFRYDKEISVNIMNQIYEIDDLFQNHFIRSQRLINKEYDKRGKLLRKVYDEAKTPYERVMNDKSVSVKTKMSLCQEHQRLDPLGLKRSRDKLLRKLERSR